MTASLQHLLRRGAVLLALGLSAGIASAQHAHVHGALKLDIAIDGRTLAIDLEAPLDSLLGFEHPPRTAAEKKAAQDLVERLARAGDLFAINPAADCTYQGGTAESDAFGPDARAGDHADLDARFEWTCGNAAAARSIDLHELMAAYPRIRGVEVQVASPGGQFRLRVKRPQTLVRWGR